MDLMAIYRFLFHVPNVLCVEYPQARGSLVSSTMIQVVFDRKLVICSYQVGLRAWVQIYEEDLELQFVFASCWTTGGS